MALDGQAKVTNIKRSLDTYINTNLGTIEGLTINIEGLVFDNTSVAEWIEPRIIDIFTEFHRQGSNTQYGETANILYQINIFVKKASMTSSDRPRRIRDVVASYFKLKSDINLKGYADGDTTTLDTMRVRRIVTDVALPEQEVRNAREDIEGETQTLLQHAFAVELDYTRLTTNP